ncbi:hypothetical protein [Marinobacterium lutimaris]|uniref:Fis family transcriptional regulator n=1 Tax=Marinobacterium lutimaris TaxID=568106 RepID=A0A1H5UYF5_9GAMM|nr:hypothetical protein [Marinobacterium lutimaris]SEF80192.1 hypothetical protein SAMN05444390_101560 [Marinobacterium lutimaris]
MRKTDKKTDNAIRLALTEACEIALTRHPGFEWLTHLVDYNRFPESLTVVCVFDTTANLAKTDQQALSTLILDKLAASNIRVNNPRRLVRCDSEESCLAQHDGRWHERLSRFTVH